MLSEAIEYPMEGEEATKTLAIGGGIYLASGVIGLFALVLGAIPLVGLVLGPLGLLVALLPGVVLSGYSVAVSRSLLAGAEAPPAFSDWEAYVRDGLAMAAIAVVYALPAVGLALVGVALFAAGAALPGDAAGIVVLLVTLVGGLVAALYSLAYGYALPAALVNYARTDRVSSAWDVDAMRAILTETDYAIAWAIATVILLAANSAGSSLTFILVGFAVFFYGQLAAVHLYTRGAMEALDLETAAPASTDEAPSPADADKGASGTETPDTAADDRGESDAAPAESDAADGDAADEASAAEPAGDAGESSRDGAEPSGDEPGVATDGDLESVAGIGPTTAETLRAAGFETVADLRAASREDLTAVDGIGPATAEEIQADLDGA